LFLPFPFPIRTFLLARGVGDHETEAPAKVFKHQAIEARRPLKVTVELRPGNQCLDLALHVVQGLSVRKENRLATDPGWRMAPREGWGQTGGNAIRQRTTSSFIIFMVVTAMAPFIYEFHFTAF
jgi:hypothetical protein